MTTTFPRNKQNSTGRLQSSTAAFGAPFRDGASPAFPIDKRTSRRNSKFPSPSPTISPKLQSDHGTLFQFSRRALYFFAALLLLPWIVVAVLFLYPSLGRHRPTEEISPYDEYTHQCRPGPWGELQYSRILIEPPREFFLSDYNNPDPLRWVFPGYADATLAALWQAARLDSAQIGALRAATSADFATHALIVTPAAEFALSLSVEARTKIYSALSVFPENPNQNEPFRFRADNADEWFDNSDLSSSTVALVKRLLYRRGTSLLFSDHDLVLPQIPSTEERVKLIRTLARKSTLLVKLRIKPGSDLDSLATYWGRGPRRKGIRALLQSLSHRPRGMTIDVAHLLPRFARARLFTYPVPADHPEDNNHDCHWNALNFFSDTPDDRFADATFVKRTLENDYAPITDQPTLGDILAFTRPDGQIIHTCVYVADDIVYTKNGGSEIMPFILMTISDMIAFYPADPPLTIRAFRRKEM